MFWGGIPARRLIPKRSSPAPKNPGMFEILSLTFWSGVWGEGPVFTPLLAGKSAIDNQKLNYRLRSQFLLFLPFDLPCKASLSN